MMTLEFDQPAMGTRALNETVSPVEAMSVPNFFDNAMWWLWWEANRNHGHAWPNQPYMQEPEPIDLKHRTTCVEISRQLSEDGVDLRFWDFAGKALSIAFVL